MHAPVRIVIALAATLVLAVSLASVASAAPPPPSPVLVEHAVAAGSLDYSTGQLYIAYSMFAWDKLPAAYQSPTQFDGTLWLLKLREGLDAMAAGAAKLEVAAMIGTGPTDPGTSVCDVLAPAPNTSTLATPNYYIEYNAAEVNNGPDGVSIDYYAKSLESVWTTEVNRFGWAAPPTSLTNPAPQGKYLVKVQQLSPVLYGYVSNFGTGAGFVGDNPHTPWDDKDAYASCMGLNSDYNFFPGSPERALDATTAHEFNHSIQFGYGAIADDDGHDNEPDSVFVEGGATWMEDEAMDYANDNYNYLWPRFHNDMGEYEDSPYPYWITFRGLTERYGASVAGGGENIMQAFWEITSRNEASNLRAMDKALRSKGTTLADAYHAYAIAVKFNKRCGRGYSYPYCFEEGPQYVSGDGVQEGAGETRPHGAITSVGGSYSGSAPDNYSLNWVTLPKASTTYTVRLENTSTGGLFRTTVACDTGKGLTLTALSALAGPGATAQATLRKTAGCQQVVAVVTNIAETAPNPDTSESRAYTISTL